MLFPKYRCPFSIFRRYNTFSDEWSDDDLLEAKKAVHSHRLNGLSVTIANSTSRDVRISVNPRTHRYVANSEVALAKLHKVIWFQLLVENCMTRLLGGEFHSPVSEGEHCIFSCPVTGFSLIHMNFNYFAIFSLEWTNHSISSRNVATLQKFNIFLRFSCMCCGRRRACHFCRVDLLYFSGAVYVKRFFVCPRRCNILLLLRHALVSLKW